MGQHHVPQHYLRHFATPEDPNQIWMYDKCSKQFKRLPIKNVAQSNGYYSEEDERALSEWIERPAQDPLDQLRNGEQVGVEGRRAVAVYLESMIKRVPHTRKKMLEKARQKINERLAEIRANPKLFVSKFNSSQEELLEGIERWEHQFDSSPLTERADIIRRQWSSPVVLHYIFTMTWRVIKADDAHRFLTSDNPVFLDEGAGLKSSLGEFSFPLSSDVALHGSWQGPREGLFFVQARPPLVKEIDRRVAFVAERFVFYRRNASWVPKVADKLSPRLTPIEW